MRSTDAERLGSLGFERPVEHPAGVCLVPGDSVSFLRALVLVVLTGLVMVAVPAVTSAATSPGGGAAAARSAPETTTASASPSPTTPSPSTSASPGTTTLEVESGRSVTLYRTWGARIVATGLESDSVTVRLDGDVVEEVGTFEEGIDTRVVLSGVTEGDHVVSLTDGEQELARQAIEVDGEPHRFVASPGWVTGEKLAADGVTFSAREVPPNGLVTVYFGDNPPVEKRIVDDGTVSVTFRNTDDAFLGEPGTNTAYFEIDGDLSSTTVRTTVLDLVAREGGGGVVGTGFEPGTVVTLVDGGTETTAQADEGGRVELDAAAGSRPLTLVGTAGSITRTVDPGAGPGGGGTDPEVEGLTEAQVQHIERMGEAAEQARQAAQDVKDQLARLTRTPDSQLAADLKESIDRQVQMTEQVLGTGLPSRRPPQAPAGGSVSVPLGELEKKRDDAAGEAQRKYEEQIDDATREQREALDEMMRQIIQFLQEMQEAQADQMRTIVRASSLDIVSSGTVPSSTLRVPVPAGLSGRHHVGAIDPATGLVTAWQPFDVTATGAGSEATGSALPDAGAPVPPVLVALGAGLLLGGASVLALARRRRTV